VCGSFAAAGRFQGECDSCSLKFITALPLLPYRCSAAFLFQFSHRFFVLSWHMRAWIPPKTRGTPILIPYIDPRKLVASHADNHLFHLPTVACWSLSISLCELAPNWCISLTVAFVVTYQNDDRSPVVPIHLDSRDVGVPQYHPAFFDTGCNHRQRLTALRLANYDSMVFLAGLMLCHSSFAAHVLKGRVTL